MDVMLDTHIALWALDASPKLSAEATSLILNPANRIFVSVISGWEVLLKHSVNAKSLALSGAEFLSRCRNAGYILLELSEDDIAHYDELDISKAEGFHKDPFDRLLLAQACAHNMLFATHDKNLQLYPETVVHLV